MIRVEHLRKEYDGQAILQDVSFTVHDGDVTAILGSSGEGKSLLLRLMIGLTNPDGGKVYLDGEEINIPGCDMNAIRKRIGMVFQEANLFPHLSIVENVMAGLVHLEKKTPEEAFHAAMEELKIVGLSDQAFQYPRMLSEGQKQRASMARTLALRPEIILMDEPTASLDPIMRGEVEAVIRLLSARGHTMVIATHEMDLVKDVCSHAMYLHSGIIYEEGTPEQLFRHPKKPETRHFVRAHRVLSCDIDSADFDFLGLNTRISEYVFRNGIPKNIHDRAVSVVEELSQMLVVASKEKMNPVFEYDRAGDRMDIEVRFTGEKFDPDNPLYVFSWPIIKKRADEIEYREIEEDGFRNLLRIRLRNRIKE